MKNLMPQVILLCFLCIFSACPELENPSPTYPWYDTLVPTLTPPDGSHTETEPTNTASTPIIPSDTPSATIGGGTQTYVVTPTTFIVDTPTMVVRTPTYSMTPMESTSIPPPSSTMVPVTSTPIQPPTYPETEVPATASPVPTPMRTPSLDPTHTAAATPTQTPAPSPTPTPTPQATPYPGEQHCEPDETFLAPGSYYRGETHNGKLSLYNGDPIKLDNFDSLQIPYQELVIDPPGRCIGRFPFHGVQNIGWSTDGLAEIEFPLYRSEIIGPTGRDLCRLADLMISAAGPSNFRYPYGNVVQSSQNPICDVYPETPVGPIGGFTGCVSGEDVHDFQVRGQWIVLDEQAARLISATGTQGVENLLAQRQYVVWGGNARYGDSFGDFDNFSIHWHPAPENGDPLSTYPYLDDWQGRSCRNATPLTQEQQAAWAELSAYWQEPDGEKYVQYFYMDEPLLITEYRVGCYYPEGYENYCNWEKGYDQTGSSGNWNLSVRTSPLPVPTVGR